MFPADNAPAPPPGAVVTDAPAYEIFCPICWRQRYLLRAVTFPLAGPHGDTTWDILRKVLAEAWRDSTDVANFLVNELAKADVVRAADMKKLPPGPKLNLYQLGRKRVPSMIPASVNAVAQSVGKRYNKCRLDLIWRSRANLPLTKYPHPYPVPAQAFDTVYLSEKEKVPLIRLRLGGQRMTLRLRGGKEFRHQLKAFGQMVAGVAFPCEMAIYRRRVTESDHRPTTTDRKAGGGARIHYRVMCKLTAWLPRERRELNLKKVLLLTTNQMEFWCAVVEGAAPWILNADHVRRWTRAHRNQLDRLSQDTKFEKRWPAEERIHINEYRTKITKKHQDRIDDWIHTASAMLVKFAERQRVTRVEYDDTNKQFLPEFQWFRLKSILEEKLDKARIDFEDLNKEEEEEEEMPETPPESE